MNARPASLPAAAADATGRLPRAREELVRHATTIFAAKGFSAASTREICDAAGVNVAAIHYYFGDKEGLYRETLLRPIAEVIEALGRFDDPALTFEEAMRMFFAPILGVAGSEADAAFDAQVMKLHLREMLEPSSAFREVVGQTIVPAHRALAGMLARHCSLDQPDDDIHQLAFALVAMANDYCMSREYMLMLAPGVLDRPQAHEKILERLVGFARALLDYESARRRMAAQPARTAARQRTTPPLESPDDRTTRKRPTRTPR
jgi:TetR/AcrR family transcriptional regulator, regulator of cefoperazone and chloramphenicol sensitivity